MAKKIENLNEKLKKTLNGFNPELKLYTRHLSDDEAADEVFLVYIRVLVVLQHLTAQKLENQELEPGQFLAIGPNWSKFFLGLFPDQIIESDEKKLFASGLQASKEFSVSEECDIAKVKKVKPAGKSYSYNLYSLKPGALETVAATLKNTESQLEFDAKVLTQIIMTFAEEHDGQGDVKEKRFKSFKKFNFKG